MKQIIRLLRDAYADFSNHQAAVFAAALAFYMLLSLAPVLLLLLSVAALVGPDAQRGLMEQLNAILGPQAGGTVAQILAAAFAKRSAGVVGTAVATGAMLLAAAGMFAHLQITLNLIWSVKAKTSTIGHMLLKRLTALGIFLIVAAALAVGFVVTAALGRAVGGTGAAWQIVSSLLSLIVLTGLLAFIYAYLPDVKIDWREVWFGACVTALLLTVGRLAIALYVGHAGVVSVYGAAGSLIIILLWLYYTSLIVFFGAEITQIHARMHGREFAPEADAERTHELEPARAT